MRPMHQSTQLVPLVHTANVNSIAQPDRHAFREVDVVRNQECAMIPDIKNESLMPGTLVVIAEQTLDEAGNFDPVASIVFRQCAVVGNRFIPLSPVPS